MDVVGVGTERKGGNKTRESKRRLNTARVRRERERERGRKET